MEPNFDTNEPPIKVVTTLGAAVLTGRTHEAVRQAIQQGRVEVAAELLLGKHPDRLLELDSVATYWEVPQTQLRGDVVLDSHGECWQVMTPARTGRCVLAEASGRGAALVPVPRARGSRSMSRAVSRRRHVGFEALLGPAYWRGRGILAPARTPDREPSRRHRRFRLRVRRPRCPLAGRVPASTRMARSEASQRDRTAAARPRARTPPEGYAGAAEHDPPLDDALPALRSVAMAPFSLPSSGASTKPSAIHRDGALRAEWAASRPAPPPPRAVPG